MYYKIIEKRFDDLFKLANINERIRDLNAIKNLKLLTVSGLIKKKNHKWMVRIIKYVFFSPINTII